MDTQTSSISVAVRVRPFTVEESSHLMSNDPADSFMLGEGSLVSSLPAGNPFLRRGLRKIVECVDDKMLVFDPAHNNGSSPSSNIFYSGKRHREHKFVFDRLFDESTTQNEIFENTTKPLLDSILDGFNGTVFAYGATGCGKTHTITGTPQDPGIVFLTMQELFSRIEELQDTKIIDLSVSYLEIYNERIRDLLCPSEAKLFLREDANKSISVTNLSTREPKTVEDVMDLIILGNSNRTTSPTDANATSSRSHAVLQINVVQRDRTEDLSAEHRFATLSIIDLAGSERAIATRNRGERLHEGANINKSLLALGNCINALCDPRRRNHIPYRDSKLTRLLKFSLGGNCKTVMIVCISPSSSHKDETLNTLKYANRAKEIKTKLIRNQQTLDRHVTSYLKMITAQKKEIEELRNRESQVVEMHLNSYKLQKEKCSMGIFESLEQTKRGLERKFEVVKWKKAMALCKAHFLQVAKCANPQLEVDSSIYEWKQRYNEAEDIEESLQASRDSNLAKFEQMNGWNDYDSLMYRSLCESLMQSVEFEVQKLALELLDQAMQSCDKHFESVLQVEQAFDKFVMDSYHLQQLDARDISMLSETSYVNGPTCVNGHASPVRNQILHKTRASMRNKIAKSPSLSPHLSRKKVRWDESDIELLTPTKHDADEDISMYDAINEVDFEPVVKNTRTTLTSIPLTKNGG